ncbi:MAG: WYL domain-containing protein [Candidatus Viridilinea halotolerans]|uniref:WYL domain-containing protein n=1 Tax=Candidatus Viridilinea halotolerans TaxID=2491704 RepID=A0A426TYA3_9CHLR|nr:MAG: WYL domain-containing protein [Candidatus Viridilinea halotolerans]
MSTPKRRGGTKRDSWRTFHRRLFLVRRLVRGPADAATLIADTRAAFNQSDDAEDIYPPDARAALRHDLAALRDEFECCIDRVAGSYQMHDYGRLALLDLPNEDLEALAFLLSTFDDQSLPNGASVAALLDRIVALLPAERRAAIASAGRAVQLDLPRPSRSVEPHLVRRLRRVVGRQQISFAYRSSFVNEETVVLHRVAPYGVIFRDGHHYLDAYSHECGDPAIAPRYRLYRLDRIVADSLHVLPDVLPPIAPPRPRYRLRYTLAPAIARQRDIALWFPASEAHFLPDGSAEVRAECGDLWQARQILMRYREQCVVHEPAELVAMLRESVSRMAEVYHVGDE